jgi:hypothetical protein
MPTGHLDDLTRHPASALRRQKDDRVGDVFGRPEPTQRNGRPLPLRWRHRFRCWPRSPGLFGLILTHHCSRLLPREAPRHVHCVGTAATLREVANLETLGAAGTAGLANAPRVTAMYALRLVHAKACATAGTAPPHGFLGDEALSSDSLDALQIRDDAHSVSGPVAAVETKQIRAGILGAGEAELMAIGGERFAGPDGTEEARLRLVAVIPSATGARVAISNERAAQEAIHATWCNERRVTRSSSRGQRRPTVSAGGRRVQRGVRRRRHRLGGHGFASLVRYTQFGNTSHGEHLSRPMASFFSPPHEQTPA